MNDLTTHFTSERLARALAVLSELRLKATQWPIEAVDPEPLGEQGGRWLAKRAEQDLVLLATEIEQGIARIQQDRRFSDAGKIEQLKSLSDGLRAKLARVEKMGTERLTAELERARAEIGKVTRDQRTPEVVTALRGMELRNHLRTLNDAQRLDTFWSAVQAGDAEMVVAFESAPRAFKLIDADVLREGLAEFHRQSNPAQTANLDDLEGVHGTITGHIRSMVSVLDDLAGIEKPLSVLTSDGNE